MSCALVLAGHGSHISPHTAGLVWSHVDKLRAMGVADEVTAAFWKEMPSFHQVLRTLSATDITVVPIFTAQGYFTRMVIPAEMGLTGAITQQGEKIIRYARTLSEHPYLTQVTQQRVEAGLARAKVQGDQVAVVIIGHSTRRTPESRLAAEHQAQCIRQTGLAREVITVFLDDDPSIPEAFSLTTAPTLIVIPFFVAAGSHTTLDVPRQLGLDPEQCEAEVKGRQVFYLPPVGVDESLTEAILELAREAGAPLHRPRSGSNWDAFPAAGRETLMEAVRRTGTLDFGQLRLSAQAVTALEPESAAADQPPERLESAEALRQKVRQPDDHFRPLAVSADLPFGWRAECALPERLHALVETIYPGVVALWAEAQQGHFRPGSIESLSQRQTGIFRKLADLDQSQQMALVEGTCGACILHPSWFDGVVGQIPCPEPCNLWMSRALKQIEAEEK